MQQRATKVNPSEETINVGSTGDSIRFLLTGDDSTAACQYSRFLSPAGIRYQRLPTRTMPTRRCSTASRAFSLGRWTAQYNHNRRLWRRPLTTSTTVLGFHGGRCTSEAPAEQAHAN